MAQMEKDENEALKGPFSDVKWEDIVVNGEQLLIHGIDGKLLKSKDIRRICSRLKIKGVKNATKETMVQRIIDMHSNREKYEMIRNEIANGDTSTKIRKEPQCSFRLMNILFSDEFAGKFGDIGNVASWKVLDTGKASNDQHFWEAVQEAFI